ncbi:hypothetical protein [Rhizobium yanglingense]
MPMFASVAGGVDAGWLPVAPDSSASALAKAASASAMFSGSDLDDCAAPLRAPSLAFVAARAAVAGSVPSGIAKSASAFSELDRLASWRQSNASLVGPLPSAKSALSSRERLTLASAERRPEFLGR